MMNAILDSLCQELGISILSPQRQHRCGPGQTCAAGTLEEILRDEGSAHLRSVLITIMQSGDGNKLALTRPILLAVSDVLRAHPTWFGETWLKQFDGIDLVGLYATAKADREAVKPRYLVGGMILERLRLHFGG